MSLKHVVLAVLTENPAHGYGIHEALAGALPMARPCDSSRVYGILAGLERAGWIRPSWEDVGRGRRRKRHHVEPEGSRALRRWLECPRPGALLLRRALLVQLALLGQGGPWRPALERKLRRRDYLLLRTSGEGRMARLLRLRELAHLEVEIQALRDLL